jgi:hypothetical protein
MNKKRYLYLPFILLNTLAFSPAEWLWALEPSFCLCAAKGEKRQFTLLSFVLGIFDFFFAQKRGCPLLK